jgi:murein DD-endopeptidase MepM/ murein hydrolase activator NlpD
LEVYLARKQIITALIIIFTTVFQISLSAGSQRLILQDYKIYDAYGARLEENSLSENYILYFFFSLKIRSHRQSLVKLEMINRKYYRKGLGVAAVNVSGRVGKAYLQKLDELGYTLSVYWSNMRNIRDTAGYEGSPIAILTNRRGNIFYKGAFDGLNERRIDMVLSGEYSSLSSASTIPDNSSRFSTARIETSPGGAESRNENWRRIARANVSSSAIRVPSNSNVVSNQALPGAGRVVVPEHGMPAPARQGLSGFYLSMPVNAVVQSGFGYRRNPFNGSTSFHPGVDYWKYNISGTPIKAAAPGVVIKAVRAGNYYGYGLYVEIKHNSTYTTTYGHCSAVLVVKGQRVKRGQIIAKVGRSGAATGAHLHFELKIKGKHANPLSLMR